MNNFSRYKTELLLLLLVAVFSLPFAGQAFHIDDRLYLEVAEHALEKPFFPYDYPLLFEGLEAPDGASHSHLPLTVYYMAFIMLVTGGGQEWIFHFFFMIFPLIAAFSFHNLASRYVSNPMIAVFLLLSAPAFLTLGHNLMTDIPMLAFWLLTLDRYMRILEGDGNRRDLVILSFALLCSAFISMLTMGLVILLASGLVVRRLRPSSISPLPASDPSGVEVKTGYSPPAWVWWVILLLPVLLWIAWYGRAWLHYDRFVLANTLMHMEKRNTLELSLVGTKLLSFLLNIGGIFCFPILIWAGLRKKTEWVSAAIILAGSLAVPFLFLSEWAFKDKMLFSLFLATGIILFMEMTKLSAGLEVKNLVLLFWFLGILMTCLVLFYSGSARYVLLALPPVILVITRKAAFLFQSEGRCRTAGILLLTMALLYSLPISWADYEFAEGYRTNASQLCNKYSSPERTVWFTGEWGFRHYMAENGARIIARNSPDALPGDIIIKPYIASPWVTLYDGDQYCRLVEQVPVITTLPLRILDFSSHAGFYSSGWGLLPFGWTSGSHWEWFNVFEVTAEYDRPVPEAEKHW